MKRRGNGYELSLNYSTAVVVSTDPRGQHSPEQAKNVFDRAQSFGDRGRKSGNARAPQMLACLDSNPASSPFSFARLRQVCSCVRMRVRVLLHALCVYACESVYVWCVNTCVRVRSTYVCVHRGMVYTLCESLWEKGFPSLCCYHP